MSDIPHFQPQVQPDSGLDFRWQWYATRGGGLFDMSAGQDSSGVVLGDAIIVFWEDLINPQINILGQLVGFSYRQTFGSSITGATNAFPIVITTSGNHFFATGNYIRIRDVGGNTNANGLWPITVLSPTTFSLDGSAGNAAFTAGGTARFSQLKRVLPFKHPRFTNLWCTRVAKVQGLAPQGVAEGFGAGATNYKLAVLTLQFTRPLYPILSDADILVGNNQQEYRRYLDRFWRSSVQMLTRQGQTFYFRQGSRPGQGVRNFPGSVGQRVGKAKLQRTWYQLPEEGILDSSGFPDGLLVDGQGRTILGTINKTTFLGRPIGTLLYEDPIITPRPLPIPAELMEITSPVIQQQYDVTLQMEYFDPKAGEGVDTTRFRGHNMMPWATDGQWYPVSARGENQALTSTTTDTPIRVTCTTHGFQDGDIVTISGTGTVADNSWVVTRVSANVFTLNGSTGGAGSGAVGTVNGGAAPFWYYELLNLFQIL